MKNQMSLRKYFSFQMNYLKNEILVFYLVLFLLYSTSTVVAAITIQRTGSRVIIFSGIEAITLFFMGIVAMSSYIYHLLLGLQNGISRRTIFTSCLMTTAATALIMCTCDRIMGALFTAISKKANVQGFSTIYDMIYGGRTGMNAIATWFHSFLFTVLMYALVAVIGYFIVALYYRMSRAAIIAVSISVPATLFILLPALNHLLNNAIFRPLLKLLFFAFGADASGNVTSLVNPIVTLLLLIAVFVLAFWLSIRKVAVRK